MDNTKRSDPDALRVLEKNKRYPTDLPMSQKAKRVNVIECIFLNNNNVNTLSRRVKNHVGYNFLSNDSQKYIDRHQ